MKNKVSNFLLNNMRILRAILILRSKLRRLQRYMRSVIDKARCENKKPTRFCMHQSPNRKDSMQFSSRIHFHPTFAKTHELGCPTKTTSNGNEIKEIYSFKGQKLQNTHSIQSLTLIDSIQIEKDVDESSGYLF